MPKWSAGSSRLSTARPRLSSLTTGPRLFRINVGSYFANSYIIADRPLRKPIAGLSEPPRGRGLAAGSRRTAL
jgi:hypothetical protein